MRVIVPFFKNRNRFIRNRIIRALRSISIFKRLIISFLLVIILSNLVIGFVSFEKYSSEIENNMSNYLYHLVDNINNTMNERVKKYDAMIYKIYSNENLYKKLQECYKLEKAKLFMPEEYGKVDQYKEEINNLLYLTTDYNDYVINAQIVTDDYQFTQKNYNNEVKGAYIKNPDDFRNSENYRKAVEAGGYSVWYDTSKEFRTYARQNSPEDGLFNYFTLMRSIPDAENRGALGVIILNISVKAFSDMYSPQELINKGNLLLVSESNTICSINENPNAPTLNTDVINEINSKKTGRIIRTVNGETCLLAFQKASDTGWILVSIIRRNEMIKSAYEVRNIILKVAIVCAVFAVIISYYVTISISSPVNRMKKAMARVDETNIDMVYYDDVHDEIGILGQKFNAMILKIKNLIDKIYEAEVTKRQLEVRQKEAELNALQMQINPHFLYNTLDMIRWEAMFQQGGEGSVSHMISDLSNLLRLGTKKGANIVTLQEEFNHIDAYIKVIGYMYKEPIEVSYCLDVDIIKYKIAKLSLQPLVENAIIHGLSKVKGKKVLTIHAYRSENCIIIKISDNGCGLTQERAEEMNAELDTLDFTNKSIGLRNVNERIKLYFGEEYGLRFEIKQHMETSILVKIPCITE